MTIQQTATGVESLTPTDEVTIHAPVGAGAAVLLVDIRDMGSGDELQIRHYVTFAVDGSTISGSKTIEHGVTTDDTWAGVAGDPDAIGWTSWPMGFGDGGGFITLESVSGSYVIEYVVLDLGGPTG